MNKELDPTVKEFLDRCPEVIHQAESLRQRGKYKEAVALVDTRFLFGPQELRRLPNEKFSDLMRAWRIDVVANTSAAKRNWNGKKAVDHLREAQEVIKTYYDYPAVQHRAPQFKRDNEGNPYNFEVEMLRDRARYCLAAAVICGNTSFRIAAIKFLVKAVQKAEEITAKSLATMELGVVSGDFEKIKQGFNQAYIYSLGLGNLDRARWTARTYFGESLKRVKIFESLKALADLARVRKNPVGILADAAIGVTRSCNLLSAPLNWVRRATLPKDFDPKSLRIN